ncbi:protein kinase, partial [Streptomyces sp. NPDC050619]|uniref:serine/threonine-protein kinase n=1 Tax=Streptomyces sp. NPDC050619 TaxID=3157214 RepID=UPI003426DF7C
METLQPDEPRQLGSYRLLRRLGAGGMGRVYLARSPGGRTVAVKVVRPDLAADDDFRGRFRHEVEIARAVSGRYTAPVVDADPDAPLPWLATSYVLGPDLTDVVAAHGALPERTVRALAAGLAAALQEIHAAGLIHRDLKPSNVLLAADGPRVIDFGIARAVDGSRMTQTGVVVGSPGYLPPEQALGQDVGPAGDIFSLGAVLAFAATGRGVWGDGPVSHAALLYKVVHGEPDLTGVPQSLLGLVRACLQKDPAARPAPTEIATALAPGGVEGVLTDWLPSAVSSTIATHGARILDLEAPGESAPQGGPPAASGTAAFGAAPVMPGGGLSGAGGYGTPAGGTSAPGHHGTGASASGSGTPPGGTPTAGSGYGTSAPGYGSGASAPGSGHGTPRGGTPTAGSGYGTSAPGYGSGASASGSGHGTPRGGTPTAGSGYGTPEPGYGSGASAPGSGHGTPQGGTPTAGSGYGTSAPEYGTGASAPGSGHGTPQGGTSAPGSGYGTPAGGTSAPGSGYGTPAGGTSAPGSGYGTPAGGTS